MTVPSRRLRPPPPPLAAAKPLPRAHGLSAFDTPLDITTFVRDRMEELSLTPAVITQRLGVHAYRSILQVRHGRQRFSPSKYFDVLCDLLSITEEQRARIRLTEQGRKP